MEGVKKGVNHLFVKNQGEKAGCTSCTRTSDGVGQDALGTSVPSWVSATGGQNVKGAQHLESGYSSETCSWETPKQGRKVLGREELRSLSDRNTTALLQKACFRGLVLRRMNLLVQCTITTAPALPKMTTALCLWGRTPLHWLLTDRDNSLRSYFLDKKKLMQCIFLFSCHHLSVALLNTSTICSRIFSQTSPYQMLHTHSRWLTDSILKKHTPFFRWVVPWPDFGKIPHKSPCDSTLEKHNQQ